MKLRVTSAVLALMCLAGPVIAADSDATPVSGPAASATSDKDELRITKLHDRLKITPAQEPLWSNLAKIMRANDEKIDALVTARHDKAATMTAVEDLRSYSEITEAHAAGLRDFVPAFETLYQSLSAEQRTNADHLFRGAGLKHHKKGG